MNVDQSSLFSKKGLKPIVIGGTGLGFGVMLATLAAIRGRNTTGFQFEWGWLSLIWFFAGMAFDWHFWNVVWRVQDAPTAHNRSSFRHALFILGLIGLGAFLYPIRFIASVHYMEIASGLFLALLFLGGVAVMIVKIGRGVFANELKDGEAS